MRGVECNLLDLGKVVLTSVSIHFTGTENAHLGVLVQSEFTDGSERVISMGPDVSQVKDVDLLLLPSLLGLLLRHDLNLHGPRWEAIISTYSDTGLEIDLLSLLDRLVKILLSVVVRLGSSLVGG